MKDKQLSANDRYDRGAAAFEQITGIPANDFTASLSDVAPRFARYVMEWEFADMVGESSLDAKTSEIVAITAMATLGASAAPVLKLRINTALKAGVTRGEIIDVFIQLGIAAGFPIALAAIQAAQEQFALCDATAAA
jgi:4-carboxymuconolactone decarboxylase